MRQSCPQADGLSQPNCTPAANGYDTVGSFGKNIPHRVFRDVDRDVNDSFVHNSYRQYTRPLQDAGDGSGKRSSGRTAHYDGELHTEPSELIR